MTRRLRLTYRGHLTARIQWTFQYFRKYTVRCSDVLLISKLENICGTLKLPNWSRHHNDRKYYRRDTLVVKLRCHDYFY